MSLSPDEAAPSLGSPAVVELTSATSTAPITVQDVITDTKYYVQQEEWFQLLQDDGISMTTDEAAHYNTPPKGKKSRKHKNIAHQEKFHPRLYDLAKLVYNKLNEYPTAFPRLPSNAKNASTAIHEIGTKIAKTRKNFSRADLHNVGRDVGFMDLIQSSQYEKRQSFWIYQQQQLLEYLFNHKYGPEEETKKVTNDDKLRVGGILFMDHDMRDCIASMIGTARSGSRSAIDAASGMSLAGFHTLHTRFTDREVVIELPELWTRNSTKQAIEAKRGDGAFDRLCNFNPNNLARIALPWSEADIKAMKLLAEYQAMMDLYTKGTGGGPGAPENFADWWMRDAECVFGYIQQPCNYHLAIIHIWDKKYEFILTNEKEPMPDNCMIDNDGMPSIQFTSNNHDDVDHHDENYRIQRVSSPALSAVGATASLRRQPSVPASRSSRKANKG